MYNMSPKQDYNKQNDSGMIAGTHVASQWPNQSIGSTQFTTRAESMVAN